MAVLFLSESVCALFAFSMLNFISSSARLTDSFSFLILSIGCTLNPSSRINYCRSLHNACLLSKPDNAIECFSVCVSSTYCVRKNLRDFLFFYYILRKEEIYGIFCVPITLLREEEIYGI